MERIGLYGGTFNPIHLGHLRTAWEIKEAFSLDRVMFIPAAAPPHKPTTQLADAKDRIEMIRLGIDNQPAFTVSDVETRRAGVSYTIDTVLHFKSGELNRHRLFFIIGSDAFLEIHTWKAYDELLGQVPFIVMVRPDPSTFDAQNRHQRIQDGLAARLPEDYRFCPEMNRYDHPTKESMYVHNVTPLDISSTRIREMIRSGRSVQYLVPENVRTYIESKGLYLW